MPTKVLEVCRTPNRQDHKRSSPGLIIVKTLKAHNKENIENYKRETLRHIKRHAHQNSS